jgi:hypothetical protein
MSSFSNARMVESRIYIKHGTSYAFYELLQHLYQLQNGVGECPHGRIQNLHKTQYKLRLS